MIDVTQPAICKYLINAMYIQNVNTTQEMSLHMANEVIEAVTLYPTLEHVRQLNHRQVGDDESDLSDFRRWSIGNQDHLDLGGWILREAA